LTGKPGQNLYSEKSQFDLVLIDAPCSGEKHLLVNRKELQSWTPSRSKKLSQLQYSLICAGYLCLKAGGVLVFSTCSVSPLENQSVVAKLMERYPEKLKELPVKECFSGQEKCEWGYQLFPDQAQMGPIYWCALKKLA
jgi:16S rRNA C967 or C1407 C5-methylase (RsmB/RsmF family)